MNTIIFNNISIRGRIAYAIMCFERYAMCKYTKSDWKKVSDLMWQLCDDTDYIDNTAYRYMEIIPEYLYECADYKDSEFDYLSEEDYDHYIQIIPNNDSCLNTIMHAIYSIAMEYAYTVVEPNAPATIQYLTAVINCMKDENILLPTIECVATHTFDESNGWGHTFNGRSLSIILAE